MRRLITNQESSFTPRAFAEEVRALGVWHVLATTERPQTNGAVEGANDILVSVIKGFVNAQQENWDEHLLVRFVSFPFLVFSTFSTKFVYLYISPVITF